MTKVLHPGPRKVAEREALPRCAKAIGTTTALLNLNPCLPPVSGYPFLLRHDMELYKYVYILWS